MPSSNRKGADAPSTAGELIDGPDKQDCSKHPGGWGTPMGDFYLIPIKKGGGFVMFVLKDLKLLSIVVEKFPRMELSISQNIGKILSMLKICLSV